MTRLSEILIKTAGAFTAVLLTCVIMLLYFTILYGSVDNFLQQERQSYKSWKVDKYLEGKYSEKFYLEAVCNEDSYLFVSETGINTVAQYGEVLSDDYIWRRKIEDVRKLLVSLDLGIYHDKYEILDGELKCVVYHSSELAPIVPYKLETDFPYSISFIKSNNKQLAKSNNKKISILLSAEGGNND